MKKSIKTVIAGLLLVPMLTLGLSVFNNAPAYACAAGEHSVNGVCEACPGDGSMEDAACQVSPPQQPGSLWGPGGIITSIINMALYALGGISVLMLVYGGIRYSVSGGNEKGVTGAKNTILYAVVGIIVSLMAYAIVNFVLTALIPTT